MRVPTAGEDFGRYRLDRVLGHGGMGIVFAATDPRLNRTVALKVITGALAASPEFRARFQAEAESLARLDSPHVITIHDHDEIDETPFIVTQYVDGVDLGAWLREHGQLPARQALKLCAQLARGLDDAHRAGVIHRDVKPGNVLVRDINRSSIHSYLCDFGIARIEGSPGETAAGAITGTWTYMAPERVDNHPASPASDIYSLGCVLWACLTATDPYAGTEVQVAVAHQQAPIPRLPGTGEFIDRLNAVLETALAKDPHARYRDADAFREALEELVALAPDDTMESPGLADQGTAVRGGASRGSAAPASTPPPPPPAAPPTAGAKRRKSRAGLFIGVGIVVLALIVGGIAWALLREDSKDDPDRTAEGKKPAGVLGDHNGDGFGDVIITQARDGLEPPSAVYTIPSNGKQFGTPVRALPAAPTLVSTVGDVDGDGREDIAWIEENDDVLTATVQPAEGDVWATKLTLDPAWEISRSSAVLGDVDGDGKDDLLLIGDTEGGVGVHVSLTEKKKFGALSQWYRSPHANSSGFGSFLWTGDMDGDGADEALLWSDAEEKEEPVRGRIDMLTANDTGDGFEQLAAEREFTDPKVNPSIAPWMIGDVDGDGRDEIVAVGLIPLGDGAFDLGGRLHIYELEDGEIPRRQWWRNLSPKELKDPAKNVQGISIRLGISDVNGDGKADVVQFVEALGADGKESKDEERTLELWVLLSDGTSFTDPQLWSKVDCSTQCADYWAMMSGE
ncbi:MAG: protein kinase [Nocardioidaceae bacterium]|nr:protein kinase [Nocardioidaceae bacterium]